MREARVTCWRAWLGLGRSVEGWPREHQFAGYSGAARRAPAMEGDGGRAGKIQRVRGNPFRGSAWAGDGRRCEVDGELG